MLFSLATLLLVQNVARELPLRSQLFDCGREPAAGSLIINKRTFRTDRQLRALKPRTHWYDVYDEVQRGLAVRVGPKNSSGNFRRTFVLVARFSGTHPTRRALGEYGSLSLEEARDKAAEWRKILSKGKDPRREEERARREDLRKQKTTFEVRG